MTENDILVAFVTAKLEEQKVIVLEDTTEHRYALSVLGMKWHFFDDFDKRGKFASKRLVIEVK